MKVRIFVPLEYCSWPRYHPRLIAAQKQVAKKIATVSDRRNMVQVTTQQVLPGLPLHLYYKQRTLRWIQSIPGAVLCSPWSDLPVSPGRWHLSWDRMPCGWTHLHSMHIHYKKEWTKVTWCRDQSSKVTDNLLVMASLTLSGTSIQPSLIPGPKILEKEPLDTTFPWYAGSLL